VQPLLERLRVGELFLDSYRGRSSYGFPVQAAEHEIRRSNGILGIDDLRLVSSERSSDGWRVVFRERKGGNVYVVEVERREGDPALLTCTATTERRPRRYRAR
jgi:hypothetical protein